MLSNKEKMRIKIDKFLWFDTLHDCLESAIEVFRINNWHWKGRISPNKAMMQDMILGLVKERTSQPQNYRDGIFSCGRLAIYKEQYGHEKGKS